MSFTVKVYFIKSILYESILLLKYTKVPNVTAEQGAHFPQEELLVRNGSSDWPLEFHFERGNELPLTKRMPERLLFRLREIRLTAENN